ncbi:uncharacterized protein LOC124932957 [Impatiens glandulifera]|uniref:uncharacterized protein LOC124932957 n=1 Tax=Impatiens glandulifera TaxID=253017 RepID=UPI001FB18CC3|nr:uncharacterized protein LOC124932957 [Impatiens glandulifera]
MATNTIKGLKQGTVKIIVEEIVPSFCWSEDPTSHYLLVDLPGFKKEEVKLQIDNVGKILASGERKHENKIIRFKQTYLAPDNSEKEKTTGKFEGEILYVIVPKKIMKKEDNEEKELDNLRCDKTRDDKKVVERVDGSREGGDQGLTMVRKKAEIVMEMVKKNKGIVITAVLAFSLGVFVSKSLLIGNDQSSNES